MDSGDRVDDWPSMVAPAEGRWIARPNRTPWYLKFGAFAALLGQLPNLLRMAFEPFVGKDRGWIGLVLALVLIGVVAIVSVLVHNARRKKEYAALLDGSFGDQFVADVTIVVSGRHLGTDSGVLWFADGLMGFSGRASSFVLASFDIKSHRLASRHRTGRLSMPAGAIELVDAHHPAWLVITPTARDKKAFAERLRRFDFESAAPGAERHWPPLEPYSALEPLPVAP